MNGRIRELESENEKLRTQLPGHNLTHFSTSYFEGFSADKIGIEYFNSLVEFLAKELPVDYIFVGKLQNAFITKGEKNGSIKTIAFSAFGKSTGNFEIPLHGPCEQIIYGTTYAYPENCKQHFSNSPFLSEFNIEGFVGYPLYNAKKHVIGLIAVMHSSPIKDLSQIEKLFKIVARRTELELERIGYEEVLE